MKTKFNSHGKLPLNKMIEIPNMIIVVRAVFHEKDKYYPQVFLDECLLRAMSIYILFFCINFYFIL